MFVFFKFSSFQPPPKKMEQVDSASLLKQDGQQERKRSILPETPSSLLRSSSHDRLWNSSSFHVLWIEKARCNKAHIDFHSAAFWTYKNWGGDQSSLSSCLHWTARCVEQACATSIKINHTFTTVIASLFGKIGFRSIIVRGGGVQWSFCFVRQREDLFYKCSALENNH